MEEWKCEVCGKPLTARQTRYCSKTCMGLGKQWYKTCPVCGKKFKDSKANLTVCCSKECAAKHRQQMHKDGVMTSAPMRAALKARQENTSPEEHWLAKGWVIQSPDGTVYEVTNLYSFIKENPDLFDGTARQAYDGFMHIKSTMMGTRKKNPARSWKGWHLLKYDDGNAKKG